MKDLTLAIRLLTKNAGFTVVAIATLAVAIGANTVIFSVLKAVLLNQLPYRDPERLVGIAIAGPETPRPITVDFTTTYDLRQRTRSFESMSLYRFWRTTLVGAGDPELVDGLRVGWDYFETLGVRMQLGRSFLPDEDRPDRWKKVVILTDGFWTRHFGRDRNIIGRVLQLNESSFTVVGVLPADFRPVPLGDADAQRDLFAPLGYELGQQDACRGCSHLRLIARIKPGITPAGASAELNAVLSGIVREHPDSYNLAIKARVTPLGEQILGRVRTPLLVLTAAVGLVLLIACANVANLLLARATGRTKEIALRMALGAARGRLIRQLLTETVVLASAGGAAGMAIAGMGTSLVRSLAPAEIPRLAGMKMDPWVLLFGIGVSLLAGLMAGLAPALRGSRADLTDALKDVRATSSRGSHGLRDALVVAEIALAFLLVAGAGLLGRSFLALMSVDPGFDPDRVLTLNSYVYSQRYAKPEAELNYYHQALERLRATPGIESAAMVSILPFGSFDRTAVHVQDHPLANPMEAPSVDRYSITPDYFRVLRIPIERGRAFTEQDTASTPPVAVVSESAARGLFPKEDPIGKHIQLSSRADSKPWMTVVGVVRDIHQYSLDRPASMAVYIPQAQNVDFGYLAVARTAGDPRAMERAMREAFLVVDKTQPVYDVEPLESLVASSLAARRFTLALLVSFGVLALALAAIGIYGVIAYTVSLRTREIGIRVALGAKWGDVLGMVLRQGMLLAVAGLALGYAASFALTRFLSALLYQVKPHDPATLLGVAVLLGSIALVASYIPARRATRVDPAIALRYD